MSVPESVRRAFRCAGDVEPLPGSGIYRIGELVLKKLTQGSLENERSLELVPWLFDALEQVDQVGFVVASPVRSAHGHWLVNDGWTASRFVVGRSMTPADAGDVLPAIRALHARLAAVAPHPALHTNTTAWGLAHRACMAQRPAELQTPARPLLERLYARLAPLPDLPCQLIHGDLNLSNILVTPARVPAFLDFTPFWAPVALAVAMFANWVGPRSNNLRVLEAFEKEPHFAQLLLRASIRMLLVVSYLDGFQHWKSERRAAELTLEFAQ